MARGCCLAPIALSFHPNPSTSLKVLRLLENDQVTPEEVEEALRDPLEYYLQSSTEAGKWLVVTFCPCKHCWLICRGAAWQACTVQQACCCSWNMGVSVRCWRPAALLLAAQTQADVQDCTCPAASAWLRHRTQTCCCRLHARCRQPCTSALKPAAALFLCGADYMPDETIYDSLPLLKDVGHFLGAASSDCLLGAARVTACEWVGMLIPRCSQLLDVQPPDVQQLLIRCSQPPAASSGGGPLGASLHACFKQWGRTEPTAAAAHNVTQPSQAVSLTIIVICPLACQVDDSIGKIASHTPRAGAKGKQGGPQHCVPWLPCLSQRIEPGQESPLRCDSCNCPS